MGKAKPATYNSLIKERNALLNELRSYVFIIRGSLRRHGNICGRPNCICKHPKYPRPHGPYDYLSHRYKDKTQTIFLNAKKLYLAKSGIGNYKKLVTAIYRMSEINYRLLRYYYDKL